ncbi:MAG TPA: aspartate/glutamate racemase family protein [Actinomycetota bacterium]|nr:aspartate/glutamate racemase family protein [Actinomycetota bacterium]
MGIVETRWRVGLLVPSSNTVMEPDLWRALPPGATLHTGRMYLEETTPEGESRMLDEHVLPAARDLATARPDLVVFGCTSAGALRGDGYDGELCARIGELSGVPTVSVIASVRQAIAASGARRVGVVTPYVDALNQRIRESLEAGGVEVAGIAGLGISDNFEIARVPAERICDFAERTLGGLAVDLAFVSCTNFPAVSALPELERRLGLPVVTSNQAAIAAVLALLDAAPALRGG